MSKLQKTTSANSSQIETNINFIPNYGIKFTFLQNGKTSVCVSKIRNHLPIIKYQNESKN
jgi:hypothetical protein